jgi:DNA processing protein
MREDWKYWIALSMVNGVGIVLIRNLLTKFANVKNIFEASKKELAQIEGIGAKNAEAIKSFNDWERVDQELEKIEKWGMKLLTLDDPEFPPSLLQTYNPPPTSLYKGRNSGAGYALDSHSW